MEDIVMQGYTRLIELIHTTDKEIDGRAEEVRRSEADMLEQMGRITGPVIGTMGITILEKGKKDNQGEIYDAKHYPSRVFVLGRSTDPAPYRPDNLNKKVSDQFCLISEDGKFYEVMYSADDLVIDSYLGELSSRQVIDLYGNEVVYMLYKAMKEYLEGQEELLSGLEKTLQFLVSSPKNQGTPQG